MKNKKLYNLVLAAMFMALGLVLPFLTGQLRQFGNMLLPMHIPILLCGLICGWKYGFVVGAVTPVLRSLLFSRPAMFPDAFGMAFELATYGFVIGYLYSHSKWQCVKSLYRCMIVAMISGRVVWGIVRTLLLVAGRSSFSFEMFISGAILNAVPGIIIQLVLIPVIMVALSRAKLVPFMKTDADGNRVVNDRI